MVLREISIIWALVHTLVMFLFLFESRYPRKKTIVLTLVTMIPLILVNLFLAFILGFEKFGTVMLVSLSLPSCIVFWFMAKYRDGRFFFTFCMVDTLVLESIYITNIFNHYISPDTGVFMFVVRLLIYPLIELWMYKQLRPMFLEVQKNVRRGWGMFALIGLLFYVAVTLMMNIPVLITERPEQLPALAILFLLMPVIYIYIIVTLRHQQKMHEMALQEDILTLQVAKLAARMEDYSRAEEKYRLERHNQRHQMRTVAGLIQTEQYQQCLQLLSEYEEALDKTKVKRYCQHAVLDAMLASYIQNAIRDGIRVEMGFAFPDQLPCNEAELATVIANALENAINACNKLEEEKRWIQIRVVDHPGFMIRIANSFDGKVEFDEENIPVNRNRDHGLGTRFIAAFCNKNNGFYQFEADEDTFTLYLNF